MAIKINARETELKIGKNPGYYYVMTPELYLALNQKKVIREAISFASHRVQKE